MTSFLRTHNCGQLRESDAGIEVTLSGWVRRVRNFGSLVFIDLRDRFGITQIVLDEKRNETVYALGQKLRGEFVITAKGKVAIRKDPNLKLPTGMIEVFADSLEILSEADVPPFTVADELSEANEELRLKYRYLDMRRGKILENLVIRHKAMMVTRKFMDSQGFVEVITPILSKSTPEGSRDYLVPSRVSPGMFYALPQSPQLFKQLLMIGGLDRYFQIATCFRDEDLRADRQPEFAQIDIEMSYVTQEELFPIVENLVRAIFAECRGIEIPAPFRRLTYDYCMEHYGCDKPDLRFDMRLKRLDDLAKECSFEPFQAVLAQGGSIKGLCVKGGADISRKAIDGYTQFVGHLGAKGLTWLKLSENGLSSSIAKYLPEDAQKHWIERLEMQPQDLAFVVAANSKKTDQVLDHLRRKLAKDRNLIPENTYECHWVTDFPLFHYNEEEGRLESEHHPFTSPHFEDLEFLEKDPLRVRSSSYDLVMNGYEMASGSQRIHDSRLQDTIFRILGLQSEEKEIRFGFFLEALKYGTPPHIGLALGFDRICMLLSETEGIRDVIAFPKTQKASCLMTGAPSKVLQEQLDELRLKCIDS